METPGREVEQDQEIQPELEEAKERELEAEISAAQKRFKPLLVALPRRFIVVFAARCAMRIRGLFPQAPDLVPVRQAAKLADDIIAAAVEACLGRSDACAGSEKSAAERATAYFNELVRIYDRNQKELSAVYSQLVPASRLAWTVFGLEEHLKDRLAHNAAHAAAHALVAVFQAHPDESDPAAEQACLEFALGRDLVKLAELAAGTPRNRMGPPLDPRIGPAKRSLAVATMVRAS